MKLSMILAAAALACSALPAPAYTMSQFEKEKDRSSYMSCVDEAVPQFWEQYHEPNNVTYVSLAKCDMDYEYVHVYDKAFADKMHRDAEELIAFRLKSLHKKPVL